MAKGICMNRKALIEEIAFRTSCPRAQVNEWLNAFVDAVQETVRSGGEVQLVGFGTFSAKDRPARTGRNPQTGEQIQIEASRMPSFKAGKSFKDYLND